MLHIFYKWRYERKSRANAYSLPPFKEGSEQSGVNLGDFISRQSPSGRGFSHYDRPRRRRRWVRIALVLICGALLLWITYESIIALAAMGE